MKRQSNKQWVSGLVVAAVSGMAMAEEAMPAERDVLILKGEVRSSGEARFMEGSAGDRGIRTQTIHLDSENGKGSAVIQVAGPKAFAHAEASSSPVPSMPSVDVMGVEFAGEMEPISSTYLGVVAVPVRAEVSQQLPIAKGTGLIVEMVAEGSPAAESGLQKHDVLTKLGDQILIHPMQLSVLVGNRQPGEEIQLSYLRQGKEAVVTMKLGERKPELKAKILRKKFQTEPLRTFERRIELAKGADAEKELLFRLIDEAKRNEVEAMGDKDKQAKAIQEAEARARAAMEEVIKNQEREVERMMREQAQAIERMHQEMKKMDEEVRRMREGQ